MKAIAIIYYTFPAIPFKNKAETLPGGICMKLFGVVLSCFMSVLLLACAKYKVEPLNKNGEPIVSDQFDPDSTTFPSGVPRFVALLKLKKPALLSSAQRQKNGTYAIDESLKKEILLEQQELEEKLTKISPDIRVLYRYRMVLNALAVEAPQSLSKEINEIEELDYVEADERFSLPQTVLSSVLPSARGLEDSNSMKIIGALDMNTKLNIRGKGVRVGIVDSGVDYTHKMFGGPADATIFKSIDASKDSPLFPTAKVKGGRDFVGAIFNTGSHIYDHKIPQPDNNPIDQSGHGTHVAGTVAGVGDGTVTYNGAAPEAEIYALKVFGDKGGSTSDTTVIAALEYAADPNQDFDNSDRLHVVNLSLGGSYGKPHSLYNLAVSNLTNGGTLAVVSAGNAGAVTNIVGSPSTADDALSVAASIDDMEQNWQFPAVEFSTLNQSKIFAEAVEGTTTKPIRLVGNITGKLVYVGDAAVDLTPEMLASVQGHVALIDRGAVSFDEKINRVKGAIGIVMVNNNDEPPFRMGGEGKFEIPGIMISKALGDVLKQEMLSAEAKIQFLSQDKIKKPELIDTLAGFSSQGPRTIDSLIKPEITAPGYNIISAGFGSGVKAARMSGTSMSSPHMAGLAALLFEYRPELTPREIKALLMNSSVRVDDRDGVVYPISRQGAGRANVYSAAMSEFLILDAAVSLGEVQPILAQNIQKKITIKNLTSSPISVAFKSISHPLMSITPQVSSVQLAGAESKDIIVDMSLLPIGVTTLELDAFLIAESGNTTAGVPIMAVANHVTQLSFTNVSVQQSSGLAQFSFANSGTTGGSALLFELLGEDARKPLVLDSTLASACDLESVGYRVIERQGVRYAQFALKLFNPITDWNICDVNVEFDFDGDKVSDREIIGTAFDSLPGLGEENITGFKSALFDSKILSSIFTEYRKQIALQPVDRPKLDYKPALLGNSPMITYDHSTLSVVEVPLTGLGTPEPKQFKARVTVSYNDGDVVEGNDTLVSATEGEWVGVTLKTQMVLPEEILISANATTVETVNGSSGVERWISYFPRNPFVLSLSQKDSQSTVLVPSLLPIPLL